MQGTFKWFNRKKGYGFIERGDGGGDVFVHVTNLDFGPKGPRRLEGGEPVEFELDGGGGRPQAVGAKLLA